MMPYRIHDSVAWQLVDGGVFIVNLTTGEGIGLNRTASHLWQRVAAGANDLVPDFAREYSLTEERAREDVESFLRVMIREKLLQERDA